MKRTPPPRSPRRHRIDAVDSQVGVLETPTGWALPAVDVDTFLIFRRARGEIRAGFKAWIAEHGGAARRPLHEWDRELARYHAAPV